MCHASYYRDDNPPKSMGLSSSLPISAPVVMSESMGTFRTALLEAISANDISLRKVAIGAGVSYEMLKKLKQTDGYRTNIEDAIKIAAFFGKTIDDFISRPELQSDLELIDILSRLRPEDRRFLLNAARAQIESLGPLPDTPSEEDN